MSPGAESDRGEAQRRRAQRLAERDVRSLRDAIKDLTQGFESRVYLTDTYLAEVKSQVASLDKLLRGESGEEGMLARLLALNQQAGANAQEVKDLKAAQSKFLWFLVGTLLTALGTLITTLLQLVIPGK
jgi:hypothetical protein